MPITPKLPPAGLCDTHVHVLDPQRFPYAADRTYTPAAATVTDLGKTMATLGIDRVVLVQPSVYGTDNSALLDGLAAFGDAARGVAVVDPHTVTDTELAALRERGIRGVRMNIAVNSDSAAALAACIDRAAPYRLAVQIYASLPLLLKHRSIIESSPAPVILDHYAGVDPAAGPDQPGVRELADLLGRGHIWVKFSAPYRLPGSPSDATMVELQRRIIDTAGVSRLLWASDWPHTGRLPAGTARTPDSIDPFFDTDPSAALASLAAVAGSEDSVRRILVDNPADLFGF
jgi:predicted TIM-barrel fold metal-dependent hydrolase